MASAFLPNLLSGQAAFVTGGGSGIGAGIAKMLARQGARVGLLGRTEEKLESVAAEIRAAGGDARSFPADVRDYAALEKAVNAAADAFGRLDVLVNSAAGNFLAPAASLSANGFRAVVDIDLCGTFNACRASFAHLSKTGGKIVSITAIQSQVPSPLQCHAGAAKAGIEKLTRDLALEWAGSGIRVNSVSPGPIADTEAVRRLIPGDADTKTAVAKRVPLKRFGTVEEVCEAVLFLLSPAGAYVTGATLLVDGGSSLLGGAAFFEMMGG